MINKDKEIKKIMKAKKEGKIYISPLIFGDNALSIQAILSKLNNKDEGVK